MIRSWRSVTTSFFDCAIVTANGPRSGGRPRTLRLGLTDLYRSIASGLGRAITALRSSAPTRPPAHRGRAGPIMADTECVGRRGRARGCSKTTKRCDRDSALGARDGASDSVPTAKGDRLKERCGGRDRRRVFAVTPGMAPAHRSCMNIHPRYRAAPDRGRGGARRSRGRSESCVSDFSGTNADDRLPGDPLGRIEGGDGIVEGRDLADGPRQSSVGHPLDDLAQLVTIRPATDYPAAFPPSWL